MTPWRKQKSPSALDISAKMADKMPLDAGAFRLCPGFSAAPSIDLKHTRERHAFPLGGGRMSQWELLVTEGHVRAARWRAGAKFIVTAGAALIVAGVIGIWLTPQNVPVSRVAQAKQALVDARQKALVSFMADKGAPPGSLPAGAENAPAMNAERSLIAGWLESLNRSNALPPEVRSVDAGEFWTGNWTPGVADAVTSGRTILVGFYVNQSLFPQIGGQRRAPPPVLGRVFGLFRRSPENNAGWEFYCLAVPQSACNAGELVFPAAIPETLRGLTPASASAS